MSAAGLVSGAATGTATVTATTEDGSRTAICEVTVLSTSHSVYSIYLNKDSTTILAGSSETLYAGFIPVFATSQKPEAGSLPTVP